MQTILTKKTPVEENSAKREALGELPEILRLIREQRRNMLLIGTRKRADKIRISSEERSG